MRPTLKSIAAGCFALLALSTFGAAYGADAYIWTDSKGVVHMTDDLGTVPEEHRAKARRQSFGEPSAAPSYEPAKTQQNGTEPANGGAAGAGVELYDGYTIEWWKQSFKSKRAALKDAEEAYARKKQFTAVYEGGRRMGQFFGQDAADSYEKYKGELPDDEKKIEAIRSELDDLIKKATAAGVPRDIRGD